MSTPKPGWITKATVTEVLDGDTVEVEIKRTMRVRLLDCWAPETRTRDEAEKAKGLKAKSCLKQLVGDKEVTLFIPTEDEGELQDLLTFSRFLGRIYINGFDVGERMVQLGLASPQKKEKDK